MNYIIVAHLQYWGALRRYDWRLRDHDNRYNEFHLPKIHLLLNLKKNCIKNDSIF